MTREEVIRRFPNASESLIRKNICDDVLDRGEISRIVRLMPEMSAKVERRATTDEAKLNRLETEWLAVLREAEYPWIGIQAVTLKLADRCRYTPDFMTLSDEGTITAWETKGAHFWDDAKVKLKVAARLFRFIRFVLVTQRDRIFQQELVKP